MRYSIIEQKPNIVEVIPEDEVDILILYILALRYEVYILKKVDWQYKSPNENSKRLKRIIVEVLIKPLKVLINKNIDTIRITGRVINASIEEGIIGRTLGIDIKINDATRLICDDDSINLLKKLRSKGGIDIVIIAVDDHFGSIALVTNRLIEITNKAFHGGKLYEQVIDKFDEIRKFVEMGLKFAKERKVSYCVLAYPHSLKRIMDKIVHLFSNTIKIIKVKSDIGGFEGVLNVLKSKELLNIIGHNKVLFEYSLFNDIINLINKGRVIYDQTLIYGYIKSNKLSMLLMTNEFVINNIELVINFLIECIKMGINLSIVKKVSPLGFLISCFGGVLGIT